MTHDKTEHCHGRAAREYGWDESSFMFPVGLKSERERRISKALEFALADETGESSPSLAIEVAWTGATQCLVSCRIALGERLSEIAPPSNRTRHQEHRAHQPAEGDVTDESLHIHGECPTGG